MNNKYDGALLESQKKLFEDIYLLNKYKASTYAKINVSDESSQTLDEATLRKVYDARCQDLQIPGSNRLWEVL
jgi:hypothetical protein